MLAQIEEVLAAQGQSERLRDGLVVAIAGPPNVGKSTLINLLARRDVAIVSPHAGTTRDIIEVQLDLDGYPVTVIDTAGIRETDDPVEQEGVRRARARAGEADLVLWLADSADDAPIAHEGSAPVWLVRNKIDLARTRCCEPCSGGGRPMAEFRISARSGLGVSELIGALVTFRAELFWRRRRGLDHARAAAEACCRRRRIRCGACMAVIGEGEELAAEELRAAAYSLGRLLGRVDVEDILDVIFREFCVGK